MQPKKWFPLMRNEQRTGKPFPRLSEFKTSPDTLTYLFSMDEDNFFLAEDETVVLPEGTEYKRVREFRKMDVPKKSVLILSATSSSVT